MGPTVLPGVRVLWRDATTAQVGLGAGRAVVLAGLPPGSGALLAACDGSRPVSAILDEGAGAGMPRSDASELLELLVRSGAVTVDDPTRDLPVDLAEPTRRRLGPELAALGLVAGTDAGRVLARRWRSTVEVRGDSRVATPLAALLGASGVGAVHVPAVGEVAPPDTAVGGALASDVGRPCATVRAESVHRVAPEVDTRPHGQGPDLVVLVAGAAPPTAAAGVLRARGTSHLVVGLRDEVAVVGPLVVPGHTACLHCVDLHRRDRDPAWPVLAAQLATLATATGPELAWSATLAAATAALAAIQVLGHLDGAEVDAESASLEVFPSNGSWRRRRWAVHPRCGCQRPMMSLRRSPGRLVR